MQDAADVGFGETTEPGDRPVREARAVLERDEIAIPFRQSEVALTVSVGVAQIPRHVRSADEIIARADARLRQSKLLGKNCVTGPFVPSGTEAAGETFPDAARDLGTRVAF